MNRKPLIFVAVCLITATVVGCAKRGPTQTREEFLAMASRSYEGVSREQALAAAEKVLVLADGEDFKFQHKPEGFLAARRWFVYMILAAARGTDVWEIRAEDQADGAVKVYAFINSDSSGTSGALLPTTSGGMAAGTVNSTHATGAPVLSASVYELFWARMDYLLGRRADWMTCKESNARVEANKVSGTNEPLCSVTTVDKLPEELRS